MLDPTNPTVDQFGKVTVSLGGRCPLACLHCYTTAPSFRFDRKRSVDETLALLESFSTLDVICLSGDTDPFLRPKAAMELLERAADAFPETDIMFTTRLIPPADVETRLINLAEAMADERRLLVGAVSLVTPEFPNEIENPRLVATPAGRTMLLARLSEGRQPVMLALRPTFPFEVVPPDAVTRMIDDVANSADVILGEIMLLDGDGVIAGRLGMPWAEASDERGELTFLRQPTHWQKRSLQRETQFTGAACAERGLPYFMRSISAMRYFKRYWDFERGASRYAEGDALDMSAEPVAP